MCYPFKYRLPDIILLVKMSSCMPNSDLQITTLYGQFKFTDNNLIYVSDKKTISKTSTSLFAHPNGKKP